MKNIQNNKNKKQVTALRTAAFFFAISVTLTGPLSLGYADNAQTAAAQAAATFDGACKSRPAQLAVVTDSTGDDPVLSPGVKLMGDSNEKSADPETLGKPVARVPVETASNNQPKRMSPSPTKMIKEYPVKGATIGLIAGLALGLLTLPSLTSSLLAILGGSVFMALVLGGIGFNVGSRRAYNEIRSNVFPDDEHVGVCPLSPII